MPGIDEKVINEAAANEAGEKPVYAKFPKNAEINGKPAVRSVRAKQEAIAIPVAAQYTKAVGQEEETVTQVSNEVPKEEPEGFNKPDVAIPAAGTPIDQFSVANAAPTPIVESAPIEVAPAVEPEQSVIPVTNEIPIIEMPGMPVQVSTPEVAVEETPVFVAPATNIEIPVATPVETPIGTPVIEKVTQNNGYGEPVMPVSEFTPPVMPQEPTNVENISNNEDYDKVLADISTKLKTIKELQNKVVSYEEAIKSIKSTLNSQPIEESNESFRKAA